MKLRSHLLVCATAVGFAGGTVMPAAAAPWVRGFVVGTYEYAFHYGGRSDYSRGAEIEPGVDCPHGSTIHFANDTQTRIAVARQPWRSQQEIDWIAKPPGLDNVKAPVLTRFHIWNRAVAYRGRCGSRPPLLLTSYGTEGREFESPRARWEGDRRRPGG